MSDPQKTNATRPSPATRAQEDVDAERAAGADRAPTAEEESIADHLAVDPKVAEAYREQADRGANQQGEGRIP